MTKTPLPADGDPDALPGAVDHLERRLGDLEAPASNSLTAVADGRGGARRQGGLARVNPRGAARSPQLREPEEELKQGDHIATPRARWAR